MIGYYLSSNNEMCYSTKTQTFSPTKHTSALHMSMFGKAVADYDSLELWNPSYLSFFC